LAARVFTRRVVQLIAAGGGAVHHY
jgi:hypothetical protein